MEPRGAENSRGTRTCFTASSVRCPRGGSHQVHHTSPSAFTPDASRVTECVHTGSVVYPRLDSHLLRHVISQGTYTPGVSYIPRRKKHLLLCMPQIALTRPMSVTHAARFDCRELHPSARRTDATRDACSVTPGLGSRVSVSHSGSLREGSTRSTSGGVGHQELQGGGDSGF